MWRVARVLCSWNGQLASEDSGNEGTYKPVDLLPQLPPLSEKENPNQPPLPEAKVRPSSSAQDCVSVGGGRFALCGDASAAGDADDDVAAAVAAAQRPCDPPSETTVVPLGCGVDGRRRRASTTSSGVGGVGGDDERANDMPSRGEALENLIAFRTERARWEAARPARGEPLAYVARRIAAKNGGWGKASLDD